MAKSELLLAVNQIAADRNLPREVVLEVLKGALATVFRRMTDMGSAQAVDVEIDLENGQVRVFLQKTVVEAVKDPRHEISLEEARRIRPDIRVGETIRVDVTPANFAQRIAAQNVRQIILQRIREAEREYLYRYFSEQEGAPPAGRSGPPVRWPERADHPAPPPGRSAPSASPRTDAP